MVNFIILFFKFFLQNKCLTGSIFLPSLIFFHSISLSLPLSLNILISLMLPSIGYSDFVFVYFLNCLFRLSIGFVVYISFLIFVSYLKYVVNSFQLLLHEFITAYTFSRIFLPVHPVCFLPVPMLVHCTFLSGLMRTP